MRECLHCKITINNPKFCSRSCAASYNNKINPKRKLENTCKTCKQPCSTANTYCKNCTKDKADQREALTVGQYRNKASVSGKHPSWINAHIRHFAKSWNKHLLGTPCQNCQYDKHTEFCHIKPIATWVDEDRLVDVNAESNLVILCPNCHWEFDNGLLLLKDIWSR